MFPQNTRERWGKEPDECEEEELQEILVNNNIFFFFLKPSSLCFRKFHEMSEMFLSSMHKKKIQL
ncbi:hypothetical protein DVA76_18565 [Acinetobacter baumannii]|nr:hypothetical protein DVA76_18565 [Acinetobacter baumannii]